MPFFLRKAFQVGPFRLNLSKSGIGTSVGVKGLRLGVKPGGRAYVHAGRKGLYFRESLGRLSEASPAQATKVRLSLEELLDDELFDRELQIRGTPEERAAYERDMPPNWREERRQRIEELQRYLARAQGSGCLVAAVAAIGGMVAILLIAFL